MLDAGSLIISEIMAVNSSTLLDQDGDSSDWIEIYNPTKTSVNLQGWYLTDEVGELTKWQFPRYFLSPNEYLLVFASGKDRPDPTAELHTNFQLSSDGEYLALVKADGATVAYDFSPAFPEQFPDISYGCASGVGTNVPDGDKLTYLVPGIEEAALGTEWTDAEFDDSAWDDYAVASHVLITEIGTVSPDYIEIQNIRNQAVDTSGWVVALNHGITRDVNNVHPILWELPDSIGPGQVLYRNDTAWGADIVWASSGPNWAMIIDDEGNVVDFIPWKYSTDDLAALDVTINGFPITVGDAWSGESFNPLGIKNGFSFQRRGSSDGNTAADWAVAAQTMGRQNVELTTPFSTDISTGMGFDAGATGLADAIQIDVEDAMHGVNASFWARIPFEVDDPRVVDSLQLWIKYNDGFVAYLNGQEVARRNAPGTLAWNSSATSTRSVLASLEFEQIDVTDGLVWLRPGRNVLAVHGLNRTAANSNFLIAADLVQDSKRYFTEATPGNVNSTGFTQFVEDTKFSVDRGFYEQPFSVEITSDTPGATIYYTRDGSEPSDKHGAIVDGPIAITTTTVLRATAYKAGFQPSNVDTQTYIFLENVIHQTGSGMPSTWGSASANYAMDPDVVNDPRYRNTIKDDLRSIPTISLVLNPDDLWNSQTGIYSHTTSTGLAWERPVSVELIDGDGDTLFQVDAGVRIQGGASRNAGNLKHSFRLLFKSDYGPTKLRYPLFGDDAIDEFDTITLRAGFNDQITRANFTYIQDRWAAETQNQMGGYGPHGTYVHLYVNGLYWGLYNPVERPSAPFAASYLGGEKEDYDAIVTRKFIDGNSTSWNQLRSLAAQNPINYAAMEQLLDIPNFIDYMIINQYGGNWDWPHNNWYATHSREPGGKWRFHSWDAEGCLRDVAGNKVEPDRSWDNGPGEFYLALRQVEEFRILFADHVHRYLFNGGLLTPEANVERLDRLVATIDRAIVGESARWGDGYNDSATPRTRDDWLSRLDWLRNTFFQQRANSLLPQYRSAGLYPATVAPTFSRHGGSIDAGYKLTMSAPAGMVYFTTDGSDPRLPGGNVSPTAQVFGGSSVTQTLIDIDDQWAYDQSGDDPGTAWREPNYVDASWPKGDALLYVESSALPAPKNTPLTLGPTTYYFRRHFDFQGNPENVTLELNMVLDDGAVVYLNGSDVFRLRMDGEIGDLVAATDFANKSVGNAVYDGPYSIPTDALVQGDNVIAVEVHQITTGSSDVVFGLELEAAFPAVSWVQLDDPTRVKSRTLLNGEWSALNEAQFYVGATAAADNLAITEINFNPFDPTAAELATQPAADEDFTAADFEFVELL
ncbi:MAG TPA: CotH kinase family protein, partial [Thermoguttaceae bacterium]|nr:CotH kinase family protein [Thermoguttaceae bacterium]